MCAFTCRLLEWFPPGAPFILVAILVRVAHATANALASTANFAYIGLEFPNEMAKVFVSVPGVAGGGGRGRECYDIS